MPERFVTLDDFYGRKGGRDAVLRPVGHLEGEDEKDAAVRVALAYAETRFASYVPRYDGLPTTPAETPERVKDLVCDIAQWRLETTHTDLPTGSIVETGMRAMRDLDDIRAGRSRLLLEAPVDRRKPRVSVAGGLPSGHDHAAASQGLKI